jgi:beta-glucanase (GH16 family)
VNPSAQVLRYEDDGELYANVRFTLPVNFKLGQDHTFSVKIYVPSAGLMGNQTNALSLKLQNGYQPEPWTSQCEIIKPLLLDQWQTLTFDFSADNWQNFNPGNGDPLDRIDFNRVVLQVNGENNTDEVIAYLDDFSYDGLIGYDPDNTNSIYDNLVWADEFEVDGPVNTTNWFHQTQLPNGESWFNDELQHYTDRIENSFVSDGHLTIRAIKEPFTDQGQTKQYTSARLNSKFAFIYGRVETRAKLPMGEGTWPAIWTLGKDIIETGGYWSDSHGQVFWPACGEIDIMEHWGYNQNFVQSALHTPSSSGATENYGGLYASDVSNNFHIYGMEWTPEEIRFTVDGSIHYIYHPVVQNASTWPYDSEQYFLLNIAMSGSVDPAFTQSDMVIDYIRVYQESPTSLVEKEEIIALNLFPNPASEVLMMDMDAIWMGAQGRIINSVGQVVMQFRVDDSRMQVNLDELASGVYTILLSGESMQGRASFTKE